ncbi:MAG TPA: lipid-A-disaccharide synthase N-terminal domain-containing protein, partial [Verrucomicrobiae bacterium]
EKRKQVVVPQAFWWLSLIGSVTLLCYGLFYLNDSVVIFAYAFTWIPYTRNLIIHRRNKAAQLVCAGCGKKVPPQSNFCPNCGVKLA